MVTASNENKMSDGGRDRASLGIEVWKSCQSGRTAVRRSLHRMVRPGEELIPRVVEQTVPAGWVKAKQPRRTMTKATIPAMVERCSDLDCQYSSGRTEAESPSAECCPSSSRDALRPRRSKAQRRSTNTESRAECKRRYSKRSACGITSNENKMSDGGRERASLGVAVWKSFQM
jgi:hypothetical protein